MVWEYVYSLVFFNIKAKYEIKKFQKLVKTKVNYSEYK